MNTTDMSATVNFKGETFKVDISKMKEEPKWRAGKEHHKKARIYISVNEKFEKLAYADAPTPTGSMFPGTLAPNGEVFEPDDTLYTSRGEYPQVDKAWDEHNKAYVAGVRSLLAQVEDIVGSKKMKFSKKAGCSCGCSPGVHRRRPAWSGGVGNNDEIGTRSYRRPGTSLDDTRSQVDHERFIL
jgi:hypothetical protein